MSEEKNKEEEKTDSYDYQLNTDLSHSCSFNPGSNHSSSYIALKIKVRD